jgi:hypothetical protein
MERSFAPAESPPREQSALRTAQIGLLIACLGAVLVIFNLFGLGVLGIFLAVGGVAIAAPGGVGRRWYWAVVIGAIVIVVSKLIADSAETLGGWLAVIGGTTILVATALGLPTRGGGRG